LLEKPLIREDILERRFIKEVKSFRDFLREEKRRFDNFDSTAPSEAKEIEFLEVNKREKFPKFIEHFDTIWEIVKDLGKNEYKIYQNYYQVNLLPILGEPEINRHIYNKPFGYPGDFLTMNYIYDYHDKYLGQSTFEKFINHFTCNIPISLSNIARKEFLKSEIKQIIWEKGPGVRIASIASGPAREMIELVKENKIDVPVNFICFDFEEKALEFVKRELEKIDPNLRKNLHVTLVQENIINIIRKPRVKEKLLNQDFIYAFGIYDYLNDIVALRLTHSLLECLNMNGKLIICNASIEKSSQRAYYEFLGEWHMIYRTQNEMLQWVNKLKPKEINFRDHPNEAYLYLIAQK